MYTELIAIEMLEHEHMRDELRRFFKRIRLLYAALERPCYNLNRLQRRRCRHNLATLKRLENEYYKIEYDEDVRHLYRLVMRYVKLDESRLSRILANERITRPTLFLC